MPGALGWYPKPQICLVIIGPKPTNQSRPPSAAIHSKPPVIKHVVVRRLAVTGEIEGAMDVKAGSPLQIGRP